MVPAVVLTQSKPVSITVVRLVCAVVPKIMVTRPRHAHLIDTKFKSPIRRHISRSPSLKTSNSSPRITTAMAPVVSATKVKKGKWVWRPKCPILDHDSRSTSESMILKRFDYNDVLGRSKHKSSTDTDMEDASNEGRMIADLDRDKGVALMDDEGTKNEAEDAQEDKPEVQEVMEVVTTTKLITEVVADVSESVSAASTAIVTPPFLPYSSGS
nr:hypothetical protein [Tanacetum cinerariifolium]